MVTIVGVCVTWDEVYPVVHLTPVAPAHDQQLTAIPVELASEYAQAHVAWYGVQRKLKRYLRELNELTTTLAPASTNKETA